MSRYLLVSAALIACFMAGPASAGWFGKEDAKKDTVPAVTAAPATSKAAVFKPAGKAEIEAALRADPLQQSVFFNDQFEHNPTDPKMGLYLSNALLEAYARERGFPCIGVLLELENAGFYRTLRKAVWWNPRFYYVGKSERGLEVRAYYFKDARLKSPEEIKSLRMPSMM